MRPSLLPRRESAGPHRLHNSSPALAGLRSARAHTSHRYIIETSRVGKLRRRSARVGLSAVIISLLPLAPPPSAPLLVRRDNVGHTSSLIPPCPVSRSPASSLPLHVSYVKKPAMINSAKYTQRGGPKAFGVEITRNRGRLERLLLCLFLYSV